MLYRNFFAMVVCFSVEMELTAPRQFWKCIISHTWRKCHFKVRVWRKSAQGNQFARQFPICLQAWHKAVATCIVSYSSLTVESAHLQCFTHFTLCFLVAVLLVDFENCWMGSVVQHPGIWVPTAFSRRLQPWAMTTNLCSIVCMRR